MKPNLKSVLALILGLADASSSQVKKKKEKEKRMYVKTIGRKKIQ